MSDEDTIILTDEERKKIMNDEHPAETESEEQEKSRDE